MAAVPPLLYESFSTTADTGLRIWGAGLSQFFTHAVHGLHFLLFGAPPPPPPPRPLCVPFSFEGDSPENILVNLLNEVLYHLQIRRRRIIHIEITDLSNTRVACRLLAIPNDLPPEMDIKSVTYHNLHIVETNGILSAEVIFDI